MKNLTMLFLLILVIALAGCASTERKESVEFRLPSLRRGMARDAVEAEINKRHADSFPEVHASYGTAFWSRHTYSIDDSSRLHVEYRSSNDAWVLHKAWIGGSGTGEDDVQEWIVEEASETP